MHSNALGLWTNPMTQWTHPHSLHKDWRGVINIMFFLHKICSSQREKNETRQISLLATQLIASIWSNSGPTYSKAVKTAYTQRGMFIRLSYFFTSTNNTCFCQKRDLQTRILVPTIQILTQEQTDNTARIACNKAREQRFNR